MSPDALRELAHRMETGLDVIDLIERMSQDSLSDAKIEEYRETVVERITNAYIDPKLVQWLGLILVHEGVKGLKAQEAQAASTLPYPVSENVVDLNARR